MTDLETTVRTPIPDDGSYTIPIQVLYQILKTKPETLSIEALPHPEQIRIRYDDNQVTCPSFDPEEYPALDVVDYQWIGNWSPAILQTLKEQCQYTSSDELKPALNGIWFRQNGTLETCATDGHMLQYQPSLISEDIQDAEIESTGILPTKTVKILARFAKAPVEVYAGESSLKFVLADDIEVFVTLINERFPDFKSLLDFGDRSSVTVQREALLSAVQSAKPFANKTTHQGVVEIAETAVQLSVEDPETNLAFETEIPLEETNSGQSQRIGLNLHYFEKLLKPMGPATIRWHYRSGISASLFTDPNQNGESPIGLLMPIRLEEE